MIRTERDATKVATMELESESTKSVYKEIIEESNHDNKPLFVVAMQNYVTRLGMILSKCRITPKMKNDVNKFYLNSLKYVCITLLQDKGLYNHLYRTGLNNEANKVKFTDGNEVLINIPEYLGYYNDMISLIIQKTGIQEFKCCHIEFKDTVSPEGQ